MTLGKDTMSEDYACIPLEYSKTFWDYRSEYNAATEKAYDASESSQINQKCNYQTQGSAFDKKMSKDEFLNQKRFSYNEHMMAQLGEEFEHFSDD